MHFVTAPCKISGSLPEIFLIEREGRALPPITVPLLLSFCSLSFCFGVSLFILQHAQAFYYFAALRRRKSAQSL